MPQSFEQCQREVVHRSAGSMDLSHPIPQERLNDMENGIQDLAVRLQVSAAALQQNSKSAAPQLPSMSNQHATSGPSP